MVILGEKWYLENIIDKISIKVLDLEKCIKQYAQIVAKNVKFHSNQKKDKMFIVKNVIKNIKNSNLLF